MADSQAPQTDEDFTASLGNELFSDGASADVTPDAVQEPAVTDAAPAAPEPAAEPAATATPDDAPAASPAAPATPEPADDEPHRPGIKQMRVYAQNEHDLEVLSLMKGGLSIKEAEALIAERSGTAQDNAPAAVDPLADKHERLKALDAQLDEFGNDNALVTPEVVKAIRERADLAAEIAAEHRIAERERLAAEKAQAQTAAQEWEQKYQASVADTLSLYPQAGDESSDLAKSIAEEIDQIAADKKHPLRQIADLPLVLATKHARRLGIAPQTGPAPAAQTPSANGNAPAKPATAPVPRGLAPVSGAARTAPVVVATPAQIEQDFTRQLSAAKSDEEAAGLLAASLFGTGTPSGAFAF